MKTPDEIKKGLECCRQVNCSGDICPYYCEEYCITNMSGDALALIQQLEAQVPKWISVKERPPEYWHMNDKDRTLINYIVYSPDYGVDIGNYIKPAKRWVCMGLPITVTHWMPPPEPPKEENNDEN